jgi:hypothetical protein
VGALRDADGAARAASANDAAACAAADAAAQLALVSGGALVPWALYAALTIAPPAAGRALAFELLCRRWPEVVATPGARVFLRRALRLPRAWLAAADALWGQYHRQWPSDDALAEAAAPSLHAHEGTAAAVTLTQQRSPAVALLAHLGARAGAHVAVSPYDDVMRHARAKRAAAAAAHAGALNDDEDGDDAVMAGAGRAPSPRAHDEAWAPGGVLAGDDVLGPLERL